MVMLAAMLNRIDDQTVVRTLRNGGRLLSCSTAAELAVALSAGRVDGVVTELRDVAGTAIIDACARDDMVRVPMLVVLPLTPAAARDLLRLVSGGLNVTVVVRGVDNLERAVSALHSQTVFPDAKARILSALGGMAPPALLEIVVGCVVVGTQRCRVSAVAVACGVSLRTLERRLATAHWPSGQRLLGSMLCLHSLWRLEELGWTTKRAAAAAGFRNPEVFANYAARHTGMRLRTLRNLGFGSFLNAFASQLARVAK